MGVQWRKSERADPTRGSVRGRNIQETRAPLTVALGSGFVSMLAVGAKGTGVSCFFFILFASGAKGTGVSGFFSSCLRRDQQVNIERSRAAGATVIADRVS